MDTIAVCSDTFREAPHAGPPETAEAPRGERRRHPRHNFYFPISFSSEGGTGPAVNGAGVTVNISRGGVFFVMSDTRLFPGMKIRGAIMPRSSGPGDGVIEFAARVQRVSTFALGARTVEATVGVAVQFESPIERLGAVPERSSSGWDAYIRPVHAAAGTGGMRTDSR